MYISNEIYRYTEPHPTPLNEVTPELKKEGWGQHNYYRRGGLEGT